jgi:hypothetical protein
MTDEETAISDAFSGAVKQPWLNYYHGLDAAHSYAADGTTGTRIEDVRKRFKHGLKLAKRAREDALKLIEGDE